MGGGGGQNGAEAPEQGLDLPWKPLCCSSAALGWQPGCGPRPSSGQDGSPRPRPELAYLSVCPLARPSR